MKCSAEDIKLCALDEVVIDEMCYTVGYLHTKAHNETVVILIDETFGEPPSFILLLIDVFTHLHRESDSIWTSATRSPTEWRIGWAVCIWPFRWSIPMNVTINWRAQRLEGLQFAFRSLAKFSTKLFWVAATKDTFVLGQWCNGPPTPPLISKIWNWVWILTLPVPFNLINGMQFDFCFEITSCPKEN